MRRFDAIVIGAGPGGCAAAYQLVALGWSVLLVERGGTAAQLRPGVSDASWARSRGSIQHFGLGGNSKYFGAVMPRFRPVDFGEIEYESGSSAAWPFTLQELEPWYLKAEELFRVRNRGRADVPHESPWDELADGFHRRGFVPRLAPLAIDRSETGANSEGACVRCSKCDGYACAVGAKVDGSAAVLTALRASGRCTIKMNTRAVELVGNSAGKAEYVRLATPTGCQDIEGGLFVVAAGAIESAALILRSQRLLPSGATPQGIGANLMFHHATLIGFGIRQRNTAVFEKTLLIDDFTPGFNTVGLGSVQSMARDNRLGANSARLLLLSEDLLTESNRVVVGPKSTDFKYAPNNLGARDQLVAEVTKSLAELDGPDGRISIRSLYSLAHQCGTLRMGADQEDTPTDAHGTLRGTVNVVIADASVFPASGVLNPTLTIVACALRAVSLAADRV